MDWMLSSPAGDPWPLAAASAARLIAIGLTPDLAERAELWRSLCDADDKFAAWAKSHNDDYPLQWLEQHGSAALFAQLPKETSDFAPEVQQLMELLHLRQRLNSLEEEFQQTLQSEKLASLSALAAGAGHEINNPLGSIAGRAQLLLRDEHDPERRRALAKINTQAFRAHEMIADMMLFAEPPSPKPKATDLVAVVSQVVSEYAEQAEERAIELNWPADADVELPSESFLDGGQIAVAVGALIRNSIEAIGMGGSVEIRLTLSTQVDPTGQTGTWWELTVRDNGPGIPPAVQRHMFDPFYSGREAGRGLGFGLSKCWRIVTGHNGELLADSTPGHGATFTMRLPHGTVSTDVVPADAEPAAPSRASTPST